MLPLSHFFRPGGPNASEQSPGPDRIRSQEKNRPCALPSPPSALPQWPPCSPDASLPTRNASTGPIPLNCNRACLEDVVNQYLAALVAHDPKRLPLSADVKYTENDQVHATRRRLLENRGRPRQLQAHLRRSGIRPGGLHGHHARSRQAAADEPAPAHPTRPHHRSRKHLLPSGRRRTGQHRRLWTSPATSPRTCGSSRFLPRSGSPARR